MNKLSKLLAVPLALFASSALAVPELQLGSSGDDSYDWSTQTWIVDGDFIATSLSLGDALLVFSAVPESAVDAFDITVSDGSGNLGIVESGYGTPPLADDNKLGPHGIYPTWYEVYALSFDGPMTTVFDTQPGETGSADGYIEYLSLVVSSMAAGVTGIHIDLYTVDAQGQVVDFAPFSHDAQYVPVPAAVWLFGSGLLGLVGVARRKKA